MNGCQRKLVNTQVTITITWTEYNTFVRKNTSDLGNVVSSGSNRSLNKPTSKNREEYFNASKFSLLMIDLFRVYSTVE